MCTCLSVCECVLLAAYNNFLTPYHTGSLNVKSSLRRKRRADPLDLACEKWPISIVYGKRMKTLKGRTLPLPTPTHYINFNF